MDDELKKLAEETFAETDSTDWSEWRYAAKKLARAVLEQDAELARLREANRLLREAVEAVEWIRDGIAVYCPWCIELNFDQDERQHAPDCLRQRALAAAKGQT